jgi:lauroyl/myristoyl acyltransferase
MFSCGAWAARWLPLPLTRTLAGLMGMLYALTHPSRVACVCQNLRLLDAAITKKTARQLYGEFGKTLADYFYIGTRPPAEAVKIIREREGYAHFERLRKEGVGAVIVTAHLGLFELGGLLSVHQGFPTTVLTLPEPSSGLTAWRAHFRRQWNVETIEVGSDNFVFIHIARRLREGCLVAALIDRPTSHEPSPVTYPNGTASFSSGILLVAAQCRVPVIPTTMVRQADGFYRAEVFQPIWIESRGSRAETLQFYSQQIADILMPTLCAHPEQWYQFVPLA